jgi:hypothetical protein
MKTLNAAIHIARNNKSRNLDRALNEMNGVHPAEGRYDQAVRAIAEELPLRSQRNYTVQDLVDALFSVSPTTERFVRN